MELSTGANRHPARAIVDLAQAGLSVDAYAEQLVGILDAEFGFDTAMILRGEHGGAWQTWNLDRELVELFVGAIRLAKERYAADLLPVFRETNRTGVHLDESLSSAVAPRDPSSPYFQEVVQPSGIRSMLQLCARWRGRPLLRILMHRYGRQRFRENDREALLRLLPTVEASVVACSASQPIAASLITLTPREREVAEYVARGLTNAQIACALGTSPHTIRNQLANIFEKLGLGSRAELAAIVGTLATD